VAAPTNLDAIRENIFHVAHESIRDWAHFSWHKPEKGGNPDADRPNSSQAFCISIWGTFASPLGKAVRQITADILGDHMFASAVVGATERIHLSLEDEDRGRLNEYPAGLGTATNLNVLMRLSNITVAVESKLTETLGSCGQVKKRSCSGIYGHGSDLKTQTSAACRLSVPDGRRQPRSYWEVMGRLNQEGYEFGQPCPFAGPTYQVMRVIASAAQATHGEWRAIFAYPDEKRTRSYVESVVRNLQPSNQRNVLHLDYRILARHLSISSDPVALSLGNFMLERLRSCGIP
jgi:hypothetical protein